MDVFSRIFPIPAGASEVRFRIPRVKTRLRACAAGIFPLRFGWQHDRHACRTGEAFAEFDGLREQNLIGGKAGVLRSPRTRLHDRFELPLSDLPRANIQPRRQANFPEWFVRLMTDFARRRSHEEPAGLDAYQLERNCASTQMNLALAR
jgi:hypothetical protein